MAFKQELIKVLKAPESGIEAPRFDFDKSTQDKVAGFLISKTFDGMPQLDRQNLVWNYLEKKFQPEKLLNIVTLVTITPTEADDEI